MSFKNKNLNCKNVSYVSDRHIFFYKDIYFLCVYKILYNNICFVYGKVYSNLIQSFQLGRIK